MKKKLMETCQYREMNVILVAFHVFTNQMVVVEIKNHKLYRIQTDENRVTIHKINKLKLIFK